MNTQDRNLSDDGIRKTAILVTGLDRATADAVLEQFTPEQARRVRQAMVDLGEIDPREQRRVVDEFFRTRPGVPEKGPPEIELDGRPARREEPPTESQRPFRFLHETETEKLARALDGERPQTIALVLAHLPEKRAGGVLSRLPGSVQVNVIRRLVDLVETDPEILRDVERALESRLSPQVHMQRRRGAGLGAVTGILEASEPQVGMQILDNLAEYDRPLAERLSLQKVEFDDLMRLDDDALVTVFDAAGPELAMTALIGASSALTERVLGQLPDAEAAVVRRRLDHPGPIRLGDMEDARGRIAEIARRLAVEGRIELPHPKPLHAA